MIHAQTRRRLLKSLRPKRSVIVSMSSWSATPALQTVIREPNAPNAFKNVRRSWRWTAIAIAHKCRFLRETCGDVHSGHVLGSFRIGRMRQCRKPGVRMRTVRTESRMRRTSCSIPGSSATNEDERVQAWLADAPRRSLPERDAVCFLVSMAPAKNRARTECRLLYCLCRQCNA